MALDNLPEARLFATQRIHRPLEDRLVNKHELATL
jgi:hypothetical protein